MFSTAVVAARWLADKRISRVQLQLIEDARKDFVGFELTDSNPEDVVVGDMGSLFNFEILNSAFW